MTRPASALRLAAAVLATAAAGLVGVVTAAPAQAAACGSGSGVSVVVDFGSLGGGVQSACVAGGAGKSASSLFASAGFSMTPVQNEPGFVCRIDGLPSPDREACVNTPPDDAYWGLWWSDGTSGSWSYSNYGVGSLKVPDGAYVGFAWQNGGKNPPGLSPAPHPTATTTSAAPVTPTTKPSSKPSTKPTAGPTTKPGGKPSVKPSTTAPSATAQPSVPATSAATPSATTSATPDQTSATPSPTESAPAGATSSSAAVAPSSAPTSGAPTSPTAGPEVVSTPVEPQSAEQSALPAWVVPLVLVVIAGAGVATYVVRRRARPSP